MAKYWAIFRTEMLNRLTYAGDLALQSTSILLFLWIFLQLWKATYNATSSGGTIGGLTLRETMWYLMIAESVVLSKPRIWPNISSSVKDGSIAYTLNKPYNFLVYHFCVGLGDGLSSLVFNILAGSLLVWLTVGPPPTLFGWPVALLAISLAWLIDFCFSAMIGLAAFLAEEVNAFDWIYQKLAFILGGLLIPLDFFPAWLKNISLYLPFAYTIYGPARLFIDPTPERIIAIMAGQMIWLLLAASLLTALFKRSARWLVINGG